MNPPLSTLALLGSLLTSLTAAEPRQDLLGDWAFQHRVATDLIQDANKRSLNQPAPLVDAQAGTLKSDRDPTDQVARRTDALLKHLAQTQPGKADWADFRKRLDPLLAAAQAGTPDLTGQETARQRTYLALCALRREIMLTNPLLDFDQIVFCEESNVGFVLQRATTGQFDALSRTEPGGSLYLITGWKGAAPQVSDLCKEAKVQNGPYQGQTLAGGMFHAPSLTFDGKTVIFSWAKLNYEHWPNTPEEARQSDPRKRKSADPLRIFAIGVDGTNLRQITTDVGGWNDTEPCELPDGRIAFMSTRREVYDRCIAYRPAFTLCSMKPDGTDILKLSFHETHEWLPSVSNDGMILYTRWDYVDRSVHSAHGIWTCFPDGRDPRAPNGNYMWDNVFKTGTPYETFNPPRGSMRQPCAVAHCQAIPGSRKIMAIGGWHHSTEIGTIISLDLDRPDDMAGSQIDAFTPGTWGGDWGGEFTAPKPLSEDLVLANYLDRIYLIDRFGNRELVHRSPQANYRNRLRRYHDELDGWMSAQPKGSTVGPQPTFDSLSDDPRENSIKSATWRPTYPLPVCARPRPPVIPTLTFQSEDRRGQPGHQPATITVQNVYDTDVPLPAGVKITALRLVQVLGASSGDYNKSGAVKGRDTSAVKIVLGTTPVEDDGSVHCLAPLEKGIYFQLLDQNGLAVQSMLSVTYAHPGERLSCLGCHENKTKAPANYKPGKAMQRPPSPITPETPDGVLRRSEDYLRPAVKRVMEVCAKLPGGPPADLVATFVPGDRGGSGRALEKSGWLRYNEGFWVNQGNKSFRTTPDAFGARGSKLWEFIQANRTKIEPLVEKDDIRLTALYMDLLCVGASSYGEETSSSGEVRLTLDTSTPLAGRDVLLVEDIIDTGLTLAYIQKLVLSRVPASLRTAVLLDKKTRRQVDVEVSWVGFEIPDRFVVGFGLDYKQLYRNLGYVAVMNPEKAG